MCDNPQVVVNGFVHSVITGAFDAFIFQTPLSDDKDELSSDNEEDEELSGDEEEDEALSCDEEDEELWLE